MSSSQLGYSNDKGFVSGTGDGSGLDIYKNTSNGKLMINELGAGFDEIQRCATVWTGNLSVPCVKSSASMTPVYTTETFPDFSGVNLEYGVTLLIEYTSFGAHFKYYVKLANLGDTISERVRISSNSTIINDIVTMYDRATQKIGFLNYYNSNPDITLGTDDVYSMGVNIQRIKIIAV